MENESIKSYNFSGITMADLESIAQIDIGSLISHEHKFDEWFGFQYKLKAAESIFFKNLINKHALYLASYSEENLKMKFLAFIFDKVEFRNGKIQEWYDATLTGSVNGVKLVGFADFMVAKGTDVPQKPYFFIQEFKPTAPERHPKAQLLAEMLVALEKTQKTRLHGGYIIGQLWNFVILEKLGENKFEYFVSEAFDSLKLPDLKKIYVILQAVKHKYCVD